MPVVAICDYDGSTIDLSTVRYANVSILSGFDDENANTDNFPGNYELISDLLNDYGGYKRGAVYIATKAGQQFPYLTDYIRITDSGTGAITCTVYKNGEPYGGSTGVFAYAPWTVFRNNTAHYGVVGLSSNGSRVVAGECDYISSSTSLFDIIPASDITIRCPDSVRQGLFIIVACDTPEQPYVDFTCTLSGHTSPMTKLMQNTDKTLRLQCGSDEGASELLLEVESGWATASKAIKVIPYTPVGPGSGDNEYDTDSKVTDISLLAFPDTVAPGGYSIMLISVNGEGNYSQRITAEISGHTSAETRYFSDGYFCNIAVGKDETAESVLVTITSAQDPTVSASVWVNVDHSGDTPTDPGTDEERLQRAFWKGFAAAAAQGAKYDRELVFYDFLYNGVQFSDIRSVYTPALQKSYPFALITRWKFLSIDDYIFYAFDREYSPGTDGYNFIVSYYNDTTGTWGDIKIGTTYPNITIERFIWANHDIADKTGEPVISASDPDPVSE